MSHGGHPWIPPRYIKSLSETAGPGWRVISQDTDMRTHISRSASKSRCAKYFKTQQRVVINPHDKYVYNSRWYMDTWILVYIIMGDKGADIPCAVATVTNNIIPTRVRRRHGITRPNVFVYFNGNIIKVSRKKNSYTGQIPRNSLARISSHNRTLYISYSYIW